MHEVKISNEDYHAGYKLCATCCAKVHVLREGCECKRELCETCGYSVVDKVYYLSENGELVED